MDDITDRKVLIRFSDDGGYNWSSWKERDLGAIGQYMKKVSVTRGGQFIHRTYQIAVSSPIKRDLLAANAHLIPRTGT